MPEVGVLELSIQDNSKQAAGGLTQLADALSRIQSLTGTALGLSNIRKELNEFAKAIAQTKNTMPVLKTLTDFGKQMNNLANISGKSLTFDTKGLEELKAAIGDGFHLGMAGTQLKNMATAIKDFNSMSSGTTGNGGQSNALIETVSDLKRVLDEGGSISTQLKDIATSITEYKSAVESLSSQSGDIGGSFSSLQSTIQQAANVDYKSIGQNASAGIAEGVQEGKEAVGAAMTDVAQNGTEAVREAWDEHSPSKVFFIIGEFAMEGLKDGMESKEGDVIAVLQRIMGNIAASGQASGNWRDSMAGAQKDVQSFTTSFPSGEALRDVANGLKSIASAIEKGANSYGTLQRLSTSIKHLNEAIAGYSSPNFNSLIKLAQAMQENYMAVPGLERMATAIQSISNATAGMGNVKIQIPKVQQTDPLQDSMKTVSETTQTASDSMGNVDSVMKEAGDSIEHTTEQAEGLKTELLELTEASNRQHESLVNMYSDLPKRTIEDYFYGMRYRRTEDGQVEKYQNQNDLMSQWLQGGGSKNEQTFAINSIANTFDMPIAEAKAKIDELRASMQQATADAQQLGQAMQGVSGGVQSPASGAVGAPQMSIEQALIGVDKLVEGMSLAEATTASQALSMEQRINELVDQEEMLKQELAGEIAANTADERSIASKAAAIRILHGEQEKLLEQLKELARQNSFAGKIGNEVEKLKDDFTHLGDRIHKMFPMLTNLGKQFVNIGKRMLMRAVIKQFTQGFKEGFENVYHYSEKIGSSFAPSMDQAASSLAQLKNSLGAAVAPLAQMLVPVIEDIINKVIVAINYFNQFMALLRGQTSWTRALPVSKKAFEETTKSAKKTGSALKDLLADWDELNIIQSESGGGGAGSAGKAAVNYLEMFEEVSTFDNKVREIVEFVQEHMLEILEMIGLIRLGLKAWKFSKAFTSVLGTLATIVTVGVIFKLAGDVASFFDKAFIESEGKNAGWLFGDVLSTGALAGIAGVLANAKFGNAAGLITAGLTFAISAGSTFAVAEGVEDEATRKSLEITGAIKAGLGAALLSAGFIVAGVSAPLAIIGGIAAVTLTVAVKFALEMNAKAKEDAKTFAKRAFASTGEGGIKASDYQTELQKEFDRITAGSKLVLEEAVEIPDLEGKLTSTASEISSFNQIVFNGDGKLSKADAEEFKKNWGMIIDTLRRLETARFETVLQGLTGALDSKSKELREKALHIRTSFIMIEQNISEENAEIYGKMEDITARIAAGTATPQDLKDYEKYYKIFSAATSTGFETMNRALAEGKKIDFGDEEHAVENARNFVTSIGEAAKQASTEIEDARYASIEAIESKKRVEAAKLEVGEITQDVYDERIKLFDEVIDVINRSSDEKLKEVEEAKNKAYDVIFEQAIAAPNAHSDGYWEHVLIPLMEDAKAAGYKFPETLKEAFAEGASMSNTDQSLLLPGVFIKEAQRRGLSTPSQIGEFLNNSINSMATKEVPDWIATAGNNLGMGYNNNGLSGVQQKAQGLLDVRGWNLLSETWKQYFVDAFRDAFGDDATREILKQLDVSKEKIEDYMAAPRGVAQKTLFSANEYEFQEGGFKLFDDGQKSDDDILSEFVNHYTDLGRKGLEEVAKSLSIGSGYKPAEFFESEATVEVSVVPVLDMNESTNAVKELQDLFDGYPLKLTEYDRELLATHPDLYYEEHGWPSAENVNEIPRDSIPLDYGQTISQGDARTDEEEISNTAQGVEIGNANLASIMRELLDVVRAINGKDFTINLGATSDAGKWAQQSNELYTKLTGY